MSKFNTSNTRPAVASPITSERTPSGTTALGGTGFARDTKSELFLLAVSNMVGQDTFHEASGQRDDRYTRLVRAAALADPLWTAQFLGWLRGEGNMRSASLVGAAEFVKARLDAAGTRPAAQHETEAPDGSWEGDSLSYSVLSNRAVVDSVLQRADEPGEFLAYWTSTYGRKIPKPVKRGIADAVQRLYDERALIKWDSEARGFRMGDVLELTHASPKADWQGDLFKYAIDRRHGRGSEIPASLEVLGVHAELMAWPVEKRRALFRRPELDSATSVLRQAGMTWESVAGWLQGPLTAEVWEALTPSMGYMALLRNLRNFDQAGVSDEVAELVAARLADPEQVARSRQFPFRFLSAYRAVQSLRWGHALEKALSASLANVPALRGRTLVVIDRSPSMFPGYHFSTPSKSDISCADQAAVFGCAVAMRAENATVAVYGGTSRLVEVPRGGSLLRFVDGLGGPIDYTDTAAAVRSHYAGHDRVLIVTDEQSASADAAASVPAHVPVYVWNLNGHKYGNTPSGGRNRHTFGGLTDHAFRMVPLLESGRDGSWPWVA